MLPQGVQKRTLNDFDEGMIVCQQTDEISAMLVQRAVSVAN